MSDRMVGVIKNNNEVGLMTYKKKMKNQKSVYVAVFSGENPLFVVASSTKKGFIKAINKQKNLMKQDMPSMEYEVETFGPIEVE
jgi:hypothetical protein